MMNANRAATSHEYSRAQIYNLPDKTFIFCIHRYDLEVACRESRSVTASRKRESDEIPEY